MLRQCFRFISDICQRLQGHKIWVCPSGVPPPVQLYGQRAAWVGGTMGRAFCLSTSYPQSLQYTVLCPLVANFGLRSRDTQDFCSCVIFDTDAISHSKANGKMPRSTELAGLAINDQEKYILAVQGLSLSDLTLIVSYFALRVQGRWVLKTWH